MKRLFRVSFLIRGQPVHNGSLIRRPQDPWVSPVEEHVVVFNFNFDRGRVV